MVICHKIRPSESGLKTKKHRCYFSNWRINYLYLV